MTGGAFHILVSSSYGRDDADVEAVLHSSRPEKRLAELAVLEAAFLGYLTEARKRLTDEIGHA
jgi:hypothetical protein